MLIIDATRPPKLYRYSTKYWLKRSLELGEFRLRPASEYKTHEVDPARYDDELIRVRKSPASSVTITLVGTNQKLTPIGEITYTTNVGTNYLTICFSDRWDESLFEHFPDTDTCLVINDVEQFSERFHSAVDQVLPQWCGIDGHVVYGGASKLGGIFSKPMQFAEQHEYRFAWQPSNSIQQLEPIMIHLGCISDIAEIVERPFREPAAG